VNGEKKKGGEEEEEVIDIKVKRGTQNKERSGYY
jgi:hypothetical protein